MSSSEVTELINFIKGKLRMGLSDKPTDMYYSYTTEWGAKMSAGAMPPGPFTNTYTLDFEYKPTTYPGKDESVVTMPKRYVLYTVRVHWEPWVREFVTKLEPWQITHRSRLIGLSVGPLRINELDRRIAKSTSLMERVKRVRLSDIESARLLDIVVDNTLKYMKVNMSAIRYYIDEHIGRSLGDRHRWDDAYFIQRSEWEEIMQQVTENLEIVRQPQNFGRFTNTRYFTGIRARSAGINGIFDNKGNVIDQYSEVMRRSRIIMFHPLWSLITVFISKDDKKKLWSDIYNEVIKEFNILGDRHFPYIEGGKIFLLASEMFNNNYQFKGFDGSSWEAFVGTILGKGFNAFMTDVKGILQLPSGITFTSLFGTLAMMIATRNVEGTIVQLGDDFNVWNTNYKGTEYIELAPEDTKYKWILGVSYAVDPLKPRLSGLKVSMDRTGEIQPFIFSNDHKIEDMGFYRKRDPRVRALTAGAYLGEFGNKTLLQAISSMEPGEFLSATMEIEKMIKEAKVQDPYAWAEKEGIKTMFIS